MDELEAGAAVRAWEGGAVGLGPASSSSGRRGQVSREEARPEIVASKCACVPQGMEGMLGSGSSLGGALGPEVPNDPSSPRARGPSCVGEVPGSVRVCAWGRMRSGRLHLTVAPGEDLRTCPAGAASAPPACSALAELARSTAPHDP